MFFKVSKFRKRFEKYNLGQMLQELSQDFFKYYPTVASVKIGFSNVQYLWKGSTRHVSSYYIYFEPELLAGGEDVNTSKVVAAQFSQWWGQAIMPYQKVICEKLALMENHLGEPSITVTHE